MAVIFLGSKERENLEEACADTDFSDEDIKRCVLFALEEDGMSMSEVMEVLKQYRPAVAAEVTTWSFPNYGRRDTAD